MFLEIDEVVQHHDSPIVAKSKSKSKTKSKRKSKAKPKNDQTLNKSGKPLEPTAKSKGKRKHQTKEKMRDNLLAVRIPYYYGDYWPGFIGEAIRLLCDEEAKDDEDEIKKQEELVAAQLSITESVTKRKRKRRKKQVFDNSGAGVGGVANGDTTGPLKKQNDGPDTPYGIFDPTNGDGSDKLMKTLAENALKMRKDFLVISLHPRCFHCDDYILTPERYRCSVSRENKNKKYILCPNCFDAIPDEAKKLELEEIKLKNSCSDHLTEEMRKLTVIKDYSTPWPHPEEKQQEKSDVMQKTSSLSASASSKTSNADAVDSKAREGKIANAAKSDAGKADDCKAKEDADGDVKMDDAAKNDGAKDHGDNKEDAKDQKKEEEIEEQVNADGGSIGIPLSSSSSSSSSSSNTTSMAPPDPIKLAKEKKMKEAAKSLVAKIPVAVTWEGKRRFTKEVLPRYTPKVVERDPQLECSMFETRPSFLLLCQTNHYQFDQLRRAKHSTMMLLYHLHNPDEELINKQCSMCDEEIDGERYTCKTCEEDAYNICKKCYEIHYTPSSSSITTSKKRKNDPKPQIHEHPLVLVKPKATEMKKRATNIRLHMTLLVHASACKNRKCPSANCAKMKALLRHGANCKIRATNGCPTCKRIWALLQIHARQCRVQHGCPVSIFFCVFFLYILALQVTPSKRILSLNYYYYYYYYSFRYHVAVI